MDKRKSERVQFFNTKDENGLQPVWIFRRTSADAMLVLLVDISIAGVQIISSRDTFLEGNIYRIMVFNSRSSGEDPFLTMIVNRKWSKEDGSLYLRHGFAFDDESDVSIDIVNSVIAARDEGKKWLRCELIDLRTQEGKVQTDLDCL
ncbi:diguanylate cyclase/phosphodiesterase [Sulfuricella sp. T08]|uniref:PilZ domain-containing protein n=1 Tax=Sulfuricella sp. T08 TaxID=1632857 RepID=UPI000617A151|nr:PilZ domain-containing protein [Sulfuricella sp. T08]GAO36444.1 diguanylate cyclase/phosphodiesterase [Sulfuricella sp. T08]